jgi:ABC-type lipoprotein export system ATPase subunit
MSLQNLDTTSAENLHQLFFKLRDEFGQTFVIVTHNEELAMADRKLVMVDGLISNGTFQLSTVFPIKKLRPKSFFLKSGMPFYLG